MRKRILPTVVLTAALAMLTACSSAPSSDNAKPTSAKGQTLTVWIMQGTNPEATSQKFFSEVNDTFTKKTGATLDIQFVQWANAHDRFTTAIAGKTTPDVAETGSTWTAEFASSGALEPLSDDIKKAGLDSDLVQGLKTAGAYDNEQYGMPWYAGVRSLVYRADVFEKLGLKAPKTWDDIVSAATKIKQAEPEMIPFVVPGNAEMGVYPWVWGAGGQVATDKNGKWSSGLDSAKSREGIQFYTDLATKYGFSTAGATTWKETDVVDSFVQGKAAMALLGSWTPATITQKAPELDGKLGATPIPGKTSGISPSVLGGSHLSVFNTAKNKDLAWQFVKMMTTGSFAEKWATQTGYFPGLKSLAQKSEQSKDPLVAAFAEQLVRAGASLPVSAQFGAVQAKQTTNSMIQSILSGQKSVNDASAEAASEMTQILNTK